MRRSFLLLPLAALAGCSSEPESETALKDPAVSYDAEQSPSGAGISPSAAPGVAFSYRYSFELPAERIAAVQDAHAQACEKLGLSRCRITGMRYQQATESRVDAMLALQLDRATARQFGQSGIDTVTGAEGQLVNSQITGEELNPSVRAASQSIQAGEGSRAGQDEALAMIPMTLSYESMAAAPAIGDAARKAGTTFITSISYLLIALISLLPWAALGALLWLIIRLIKPRLTPRRQVAAFAPEAP